MKTERKEEYLGGKEEKTYDFCKNMAFYLEDSEKCRTFALAFET